MKIFLVLTFLFAVGAFLGWVLELFFRRFVHKKWINPGFLHGPYLPLYGFGLVLLYAAASIPLNGIEQTWLRYVVLLLIICAAMTLIEYIAGLIFIKGMGIRLWDYSDRKGNIQGIICPLFSFFWTLIGGLYAIFLHPVVNRAVEWFTGNLYYSFFVGVFFGLLIWDFASSVKLSVRLKSFAKEHNVMVKYEEVKLMIKKTLDKERLKSSFLSPFKASAETIKATLSKYAENFKAREAARKSKKKKELPSTEPKEE